jgi:hypothetical protein
MKYNCIFFHLLLIFLYISCNKKNVTFNKDEWLIVNDLEIYPNREKMILDLINNHQLVGLSYKQLIQKIGEPEKKYNAESKVYYPIITNYERNIDPTYSKFLCFFFNKDSIIVYYNIIENTD